jgi:hypothetical protein
MATVAIHGVPLGTLVDEAALLVRALATQVVIVDLEPDALKAQLAETKVEQSVEGVTVALTPE